VRKYDEIILSISEQYARCMLSGTKTVEFRRRTIPVASGSRIWIYTKIPIARIELYAIVDQVFNGHISDIWQQFASRGAISKSDFDNYYSGTMSGSALILREIFQLSQPVTLGEMRRVSSSFHPPQFFQKLLNDSPELGLLGDVGSVRVPLSTA